MIPTFTFSPFKPTSSQTFIVPILPPEEPASPKPPMATKPKKALAEAAKPKRPVPLEKQFKTAPTVNIQAEYKFPDSEKQALGMTLAGLTQKREEIAAHRKEVNAQLSAQSEEVNAQIKNISNKLRAGFEMRATDALSIFDASAGKKSFYRKDTKELIRTEPMLPSDYEQELPMPGLPVSQKKEPEPKPKKGEKKAKKPKASPDGQTSFADALNSAAAGKELPRVQVVLKGEDSAKINRDFRKAAKKAGWPEAAIKLLKAETDKVETVEKMLAIYAAHIEPPAAAE